MVKKLFAEEKTAKFITAIGSPKNREKLEFITVIWTNKWEIKEFITAMEYLI